MSKVNNFDVLKRMSADDMDIRLGTDILNMKAVKAGTQITIGFPGNVIGQIYSGQLVACLILYDKDQFNQLKSRMESE